MKLNYSIMLLLVLLAPVVYSQDSSNITDRGAAAQNLLVTPERLMHLCEGRTGAYWCDGFLSAVLAGFGLDPTDECLPSVDVNRFIHEGAWALTEKWLTAQPPEVEVSLYEAVISALKEEGACNI